jgi:hypothetical protein
MGNEGVMAVKLAPQTPQQMWDFSLLTCVLDSLKALGVSGEWIWGNDLEPIVFAHPQPELSECLLVAVRVELSSGRHQRQPPDIRPLRLTFHGPGGGRSRWIRMRLSLGCEGEGFP